MVQHAMFELPEGTRPNYAQVFTHLLFHFQPLHFHSVCQANDPRVHWMQYGLVEDSPQEKIWAMVRYRSSAPSKCLPKADSMWEPARCVVADWRTQRMQRSAAQVVTSPQHPAHLVLQAPMLDLSSIGNKFQIEAFWKENLKKIAFY